MRVLHCVYGMNRGGLETFIMNVYRNIDRDKIQFDFLVHTNKECAYDQEIKDLGGKIYFIPSRSHGIIENRLALDEFFKNHTEYQIVHQHVSSLSYIEPLKVAKKNGVPVRIVHGHSTRQGGNYLHKFVHGWNQLYIRNIATHYFACSDLAAKWLFSNKQYTLGEFRIINNGIDIRRFIFNRQLREIVRYKLGIDDELVIGHIGRFVYPKNHNFLIDIFKAFHNSYPKSKLLLIGEGELQNEIKRKVEGLGLKKDVIFTGVREDVSALLQAMDVFVMPSYYEGLPVTLVEAQTSGLKCIVSDTITKQAQITDLLSYKSLKESPDFWADDIMRNLKYERENTEDYIAKLDFDIIKIAKSLQSFYLKVVVI